MREGGRRKEWGSEGKGEERRTEGEEGERGEEEIGVVQVP